MTDEENSPRGQGPVMIAATRIINPPPARIGQIGSNFTLPRTVPLKAVVAGAIGIAVGVPIGALLGSAQSIIIAMIVGAAVGVGAVTIQPAKGENLLQWLTALVRGRARQRRVSVGGRQLAVYVGIARVTRVAAGAVRVVASSVEVDPDAYDERGVLRSEANRNLSDRGPRTLREQQRNFRHGHDQIGLPPDTQAGRRVVDPSRPIPVVVPGKTPRLGARRPDETVQEEPAEQLRHPLLDEPARPVAPRTAPPRLGARRPGQDPTAEQATPPPPDQPRRRKR